MSDPFVPLKCPSCGAKLDIYNDMEKFACGYCGNEMLVQRRGGTVALKAIEDGIRQVQKGTDRTAAELALVRLERELQNLRELRPTISVEMAAEGVKALSDGFGRWAFAICGVILAGAGVMVFPILRDSGETLTGMAMLAGGLGFFGVSYAQFRKSGRLKEERSRRVQEQRQRMQNLEAKIASKEAEIGQARQVVESR